MKENKPCRDAQGQYYWPKIYLMEDNDAKAVSSINHEDENTQDSFHIAELSNSNTRTAAFTPQFSSFQ